MVMGQNQPSNKRVDEHSNEDYSGHLRDVNSQGYGGLTLPYLHMFWMYTNFTYDLQQVDNV